MTQDEKKEVRISEVERFVLTKWEEFPSAISQVKEKYGEREILGQKEKVRILYRGQPNSAWALNSTLDRFVPSPWSIEEYAELAIRCAPCIGTFTNREWHLPDLQAIKKEIREKSDGFSPHIPCYDFWVYLRHHGFPSPLLDWTMSPYIAAFFAFAERGDADRAIFAYVELPKGVKASWRGETKIDVWGPYVHTHKRHFLQQSWYSICTREDNGSYVFAGHEDVFRRGDTRQDKLIKIVIPGTERIKALSGLEEMNINHFSLFQSEDALMRTLAIKEIEMAP